MRRAEGVPLRRPPLLLLLLLLLSSSGFCKPPRQQAPPLPPTGHGRQAQVESHGQPAAGGGLPNHNPRFTRGADLYVLEDSGRYGPSVWATNVVDGDGPLVNGRPTDSGRQSVEFRFIYNDVTLFDGVAGRPKMADDGLITFQPMPGRCGVASVKVELIDSGTPDCVPGTDLAGNVFVCPAMCNPPDCHVSTQSEFLIEVVCVNDPPSYAHRGDLTTLENSGLITIEKWAYNVQLGAQQGSLTDSSELTQTLTFTVTNNNNALFSVQPRLRWVTGMPPLSIE